MSLKDLGLTDDYSAIYNANPARMYNYQLGWWDKIGNAFGFRTKEDRYREEMENKAYEYDAQLASIAREEKYNSAASASDRERTAGLNPDLLGLDSAGSASEFNEPETGVTVPDGSNPEVQNAIGNLFSVASTLTGMAGNISEISGQLLSNDALRTDLVTKMTGAASNYLLNSLGPEDLIRKDGFINPLPRFSSGLGKRFDKAFNASMRNVFGSEGFRNLAMKSMKGTEEDRKELAKSRGFRSFTYDDDDYARTMGVISDAAFDLFKLDMDYRSSALKNKKRYEDKFGDLYGPEKDALNEVVTMNNDTSYQQAYASAGGPEVQAGTDIAVNEATSANAKKSQQSDEMVEKMNSVISNIVNKLHKQAEDGNKFASIGLILISAIQSNFMSQLLPHVNIDRSSNTKNIDNVTHNYGDTNIESYH